MLICASLNDVLEVIAEYLPFAIILILILMIVLIASIDKGKFTSREIALAATAISASFILNQAKLRLGANGGSVSAASIVPIALYCYFFGLKKGVFAAFCYSFLKMVQGAYVIGFFQAMLDYILPYSVVALVALARPLYNKFKGYELIAALFCVYILRFIFHTAAGVIYWETPLAGSIVYNLTYLPLDFLIAGVVLFLIVKNNFIARLERVLAIKKPKQIDEPKEVA